MKLRRRKPVVRKNLYGAEICKHINRLRGGTQLKTPRPVLLVDTREQIPLDFSRFEGWFAGIERKALKLGDYSIAGMEEICVVERKELPDLVHSCTTDRCVFTNPLRRMAQCPHRLLLITSSLSQIKSLYSHGGNPNRITQSLIAMLAGLQIPFLCSETHELGEEIVCFLSLPSASLPLAGDE